MALVFKPKPTTGWRTTFWRFAQAMGVALTVVLLAGLLFRPQSILNILWNVVIPLLPATFLISTAIWRSVCPLATLNMFTNGWWKRKRLTAKNVPRVQAMGIMLLLLLVPARRFLFNEHGDFLAIVIIAVAVAALVLGSVFDSKSGFCNAICPVLPVEKLYGQHPLWGLQNPRCATCQLCTAKGCIDLSPNKSIHRAVKGGSGNPPWLTSAYGVFAASFPGFVFGYFSVENTSIAGALSIYLQIGAWALASYVFFYLMFRLLRVPSSIALPLVAAVAIGVYYWFASPGISSAFNGSVILANAIRSVALGLAAYWLYRALGDVRSRPHLRQNGQEHLRREMIGRAQNAPA